MLPQGTADVKKSGLDSIATLFFILKKETLATSMVQFKPLKPVQSFQGDSLLVTTESLEVSGVF